MITLGISDIHSFPVIPGMPKIVLMLFLKTYSNILNMCKFFTHFWYSSHVKRKKYYLKLKVRVWRGTVDNTFQFRWFVHIMMKSLNWNKEALANKKLQCWLVAFCYWEWKGHWWKIQWRHKYLTTQVLLFSK